MADDHAPVPQIKLNGSPLSATSAGSGISRVLVEAQRNAPVMCVIEAWDDALTMASQVGAKPGDALEVLSSSADEGASGGSLFKGEVVALETSFDKDGQPRYVMRAYSKAHRLHRTRQSQTFMDVKDSDVVSQLGADAIEVGEPTQAVHPYLLQRNQTDWEFVLERALENGYELVPSGDKLKFQKAGTGIEGPEVVVKRGDNLLSWRSRITSAEQPKVTDVLAWDVVKMEKIEGKAEQVKVESAPAGGQTPETVAEKFGATKEAVRTQVLPTADLAKIHAEAWRNRLAGVFFEADGVATGNPKIMPGVKLKVEGVGTEQSGTYMVSMARHVFNSDGYTTEFTISGTNDRTLFGLVQPGAVVRANGHNESAALLAPVIATVTNNSDENAADGKKLGRVKVEYGWLGKIESTWAPVVSASAGDGRGLMAQPEVNDQVLVVFEHGDPRRPFVLGGIWHNPGAPPQLDPPAVKNGKTDIIALRSREGNMLSLVDTNGESKVEMKSVKGATIEMADKSKTISIVDETKQQSIKVDGDKKSIAMESGDQIKLNSVGDTILEAKGNITIKATGEVKISGMSITVDAKTSLTLKGGAKAELSAPMTDVKGQTVVAIQGAVVKLN